MTDAAKVNLALAYFIFTNTFYIPMNETIKSTSQKISSDMDKIWIEFIDHGFQSKVFLK